MCGTCVAVGAAVLAAPVGVQAGLEAEVRAVVARDDRLGMVTKELGGHPVGLLALIVAQVQAGEAQVGVAGRATATGWSHAPRCAGRGAGSSLRGLLSW